MNKIIKKIWLLLILGFISAVFLFAIPRIFILNILFDLRGDRLFFIGGYLIIWFICLILALIASLIINKLLKKKNVFIKKRIIYCSLSIIICFTPIIFTNWYFVSTRIMNFYDIKSIESKMVIKRENGYMELYTLKGLTKKEYKLIWDNVNVLPEISSSAINIDISILPGDGFQDDRSITLQYTLPLDVKVDSINSTENKWPRIEQKFIIEKNRKIVKWSYKQI